MPISIRFDLTPNHLKRAGAKAFDMVGVNRIGFGLRKMLLGPFIRAVNYHVVNAEQARKFERHLQYYQSHFVSVDRGRLEALVSGSKWPGRQPGLILSFDDGHRTHYDVVAPLLEKYGFTGWFFVPVGLMDLDPSDDGDLMSNGERDLVLSMEQLKYLDERHIVGSHSETHCRLRKDVPQKRMESEIHGSRVHLENVLGHPIEIFCWVGGEEENYSREAAKLVRRSYKYSFMTNNAVIRSGTDRLQLQRTNIEAGDPLSLVRFQLSGLMDLYYWRKRRRVNDLTHWN